MCALLHILDNRHPTIASAAIIQAAGRLGGGERPQIWGQSTVCYDGGAVIVYWFTITQCFVCVEVSECQWIHVHIWSRLGCQVSSFNLSALTAWGMCSAHIVTNLQINADISINIWQLRWFVQPVVGYLIVSGHLALQNIFGYQRQGL